MAHGSAVSSPARSTAPDRNLATLQTGRSFEVLVAAKFVVEPYGIGLFQRLDHLFDALDAELMAAQDGLAREETTWRATPISSPDRLSTKTHYSLLSATLRASTASSPTMVARAVHLPRLV
jgi:hypothetical protein